ncbi:MAG: cytochrome c biogenesis protein [Candidatus Omnitrophota bacterium]
MKLLRKKLKRYLVQYVFPLVVMGFVLAQMSGLFPQKNNLSLSRQFSGIPVLMNGRIKPLDTVARNSLMIISGKQNVRDKKEGTVIHAAEWLMDTLLHPEISDKHKVFLVHHPDLVLLIDGEEGKKYYSFTELLAHEDEITALAKTALSAEAEVRTAFERAVVHLYESMVLYYRLKNSLCSEGSRSIFQELTVLSRIIDKDNQLFETDRDHAAAFREYADYFQYIDDTALLRFIPAEDGTEWMTTGRSLIASLDSGTISPLAWELARMRDAYRNGNGGQLAESLTLYFSQLKKISGLHLERIRLECFLNGAQPFHQAMVLYVLALMTVLVSWFFLSPAWRSSALLFLGSAFVIHTFGLGTRIYLQGRPPVTNLYSSAVFIGWASVFFCFLLERIFRRGVAVAIGACVGFSTLVIAHHLSADGDTLEMMQAVLDSNFWLATHVVAITLGYSATFVAGFTGALFILRGVFTRSLLKIDVDNMQRMVYGTICFALLLSFTGTVLGGIWADQSWGRFWGWDPKENGALMIVIWNAVILHARYAGMIRARGLMVCAVIGNMITAFSWFGVNLLGVGLHSYGFLDKTFKGFLYFELSQLLIVVTALIPYNRWSSFNERAPNGPPLLKSIRHLFKKKGILYDQAGQSRI